MGYMGILIEYTQSHILSNEGGPINNEPRTAFRLCSVQGCWVTVRGLSGIEQGMGEWALKTIVGDSIRTAIAAPLPHAPQFRV